MDAAETLSKPRALVTGATGALGPAVVKTLHQSGYTVRALCRTAPEPGLLPDAAEILKGDITDREFVRSACTDVQTIFHMAALLHVVDPPVDLRPQYQRINVEGTANVMAAAVPARVKRVVFFSTVAVYGKTNGAICDEDTAPQPETYYAQTKVDAEKVVLEALRADGRPLGAVLRLAAVYGPRVKGNYRRLLDALDRGRFVPIGSGGNRRTLVYDQDVARAALLAAGHPDAAGRVFNVTDGGFHTIREIVAAMCQALGRPGPRLCLPVGPIRLAARIIEKIAGSVGAGSPKLTAAVEKFVEDVAVRGDRLRRELGFSPRYTLSDGWRETVTELSRSTEGIIR